jgi:hypothetical protein
MVIIDGRIRDPTPIEPSGKRFRTTRGNDAEVTDEFRELFRAPAF